jgi:hypothetical protein
MAEKSLAMIRIAYNLLRLLMQQAPTMRQRPSPRSASKASLTWSPPRMKAFGTKSDAPKGTARD